MTSDPNPTPETDQRDALAEMRARSLDRNIDNDWLKDVLTANPSIEDFCPVEECYGSGLPGCRCIHCGELITFPDPHGGAQQPSPNIATHAQSIEANMETLQNRLETDESDESSLTEDDHGDLLQSLNSPLPQPTSERRGMGARLDEPADPLLWDADIEDLETAQNIFVQLSPNPRVNMNVVDAEDTEDTTASNYGLPLDDLSRDDEYVLDPTATGEQRTAFDGMANDGTRRVIVDVSSGYVVDVKTTLILGTIQDITLTSEGSPSI